MSKHPDKRGHILAWLAWTGLLLWVIACSRPAEATKTPTITPLPTPDELAIYLMLTRRYTGFEVIMRIGDMSADEVARILQALQAVEPPARIEALHDQALDAYRQIAAAKLLLPGADSELRAEAFFMIDWGINRLLDYRAKLDSSQQ